MAAFGAPATMTTTGYQADPTCQQLDGVPLTNFFLPALHASVTHWELVTQPDKHVRFFLQVGFTDGNGVPFSWQVSRRFNAFENLESFLTANAAYAERPKLPSKMSGLLSSYESQAAKRLPLLIDYVRGLLAVPSLFYFYEVQHFFGVHKQLMHLYPHKPTPLLPPRIETAAASSVEPDHRDALIYVKLLQARGLPVLRPGKLPNTYATLHLCKGVLLNKTPPSVRTDSFEASLDPQWNVEALFFSKNRSIPLRLHVWQQHRLSANQTLGFATLELPRMQPHRLYDVWLPLVGPVPDCGQVRVQAQITPVAVAKQKISVLPSFRLQLQRTDFFPGQVVAGLLVLNVGQPIAAHRLSIQLLGYEQTRWTETRTEHYTDAHGHPQTRTRQQPYGQTWALLNETRVLWRRTPGVDVIPSGSYIWPFEFVLPARLPASFESDYAWCRYALKATVHRPGLRLNQRVHTPVRMLAPYVSLSPLPPSYGRCDRLPFRSGDQVVYLQVTMPHAITIIGEPTHLTVFVDNQTRHRVLDAKITLNRTVVARSGPADSKVQQTSQLIQHIRDGFVVGPGENRQLVVEMFLPADTQPSLPDDISPLIQVSYTLLVACNISGFLTGSSTAEIPLIVSHRTPPPEQLPYYAAPSYQQPLLQQTQIEAAVETGSTAVGMPRFAPDMFAPLPDPGYASSPAVQPASPVDAFDDPDDEFKPDNATPMFAAPPPPVSVFFPGLDYVPYHS